MRAFPVLERDGIVWIWMGDAAAADPALAPAYPELSAPDDWHPVKGYLVTPADYRLVIDNLMDLTHPEFLHDGSLGSPALKTAHYEVNVEGPRVVHSNRWFASGPIPPMMERSFPTGGSPVEHWVNMRWEACSSLFLEVGVTLAGTPRAAGWNTYAAHLLTPETPTRTHYFFATILPAAEARQHVDDSQLREVLTNIFAGEDSPMLAAVQQRMGDRELWSMKPVTLPGDEGAVAVRRALALLIDAQPR